MKQPMPGRSASAWGRSSFTARFTAVHSTVARAPEPLKMRQPARASSLQRAHQEPCFSRLFAMERFFRPVRWSARACGCQRVGRRQTFAETTRLCTTSACLPGRLSPNSAITHIRTNASHRHPRRKYQKGTRSLQGRRRVYFGSLGPPKR